MPLSATPTIDFEDEVDVLDDENTTDDTAVEVEPDPVDDPALNEADVALNAMLDMVASSIKRQYARSEMERIVRARRAC